MGWATGERGARRRRCTALHGGRMERRGRSAACGGANFTARTGHAARRVLRACANCRVHAARPTCVRPLPRAWGRT